MERSILKFCYSRLIGSLAPPLIGTFRVAVPIFVALLFFGALVWAKSDDPFARKWFKIKAKIGKVESRNTKVECVAVIPKKEEIGKASSSAKAMADKESGNQPWPVVVYLHDSGGTLMTDGRPLRQLAELGMVAVSMEYNQTNYAAFEEQFSAFLKHFEQEGTEVTEKRIAWVGDGLGAQNAVRYLLKHPEARPRVLVLLSGGWGPEMEEFGRKERIELRDENFKSQDFKFQTPTLLVYGERDEGGKAEIGKTESRNYLLNGADVSVKSLPGLGHSLEPDRALVIREIGEYVKAYLTPEHPEPEFTRPKTIPFLVCALPSFLWLGFWAAKRHKNRKSGEESQTQEHRSSKWEIGLRVAAGVLAALALAQTAWHLIPPRLEVSGRTLQIARRSLLAPKWHEDFEALACLPIWKGQRLKTLLTHMELAHYCVYELINWKLPPEIYRDYVLCPVIEGSETEMDWRRPLWEFYYPRIRKENTTEAAAEIVVRTLRERVTVWPGFDHPQGVDTIWKEQITGEKGFELIYVATLRSVGVPARLDSVHKAEFWDGDKWRPAPRPLLSTWQDLTRF